MLSPNSKCIFIKTYIVHVLWIYWSDSDEVEYKMKQKECEKKIKLLTKNLICSNFSRNSRSNYLFFLFYTHYTNTVKYKHVTPMRRKKTFFRKNSLRMKWIKKRWKKNCGFVRFLLAAYVPNTQYESKVEQEKKRTHNLFSYTPLLFLSTTA